MYSLSVSLFVTFFAITSAADGTDINNATRNAVSNMNHFALFLTNDMIRPGSTENFVFSPYSIIKALMVVHEGARGNTRREIELRSLKFFKSTEELHEAVKNLENELDKLNQHITFASGSYGLFDVSGSQLNQNFVTSVRQHFNTEIRPFNESNVDTVVRQINEEIKESLKSSPKADLLTLQKPEPGTKGVLYNYVYLKGDWSEAFPVNDTKPGDFSWTENRKERKKSIPMMHLTSEKFLYNNTKKYEVLGMPFEGNQLALFIFLNHEKYTLEKVLRELTNNRLAEVVKYIVETEVKVTVPKFELIVKEMDLKPFLTSWGINKLFTGDSDLSGITRDAFVSEIKHKAFFKIDEKGGEAGAATGLIIDSRSNNAEEFIADHPFLFVVGHRPTGAVLFQGIFNKPPLDEEVASSECQTTLIPNSGGIVFPQD